MADFLNCQMASLAPLGFMALVTVCALWIAVTAYDKQIKELLARWAAAIDKITKD